jgi:cell division septum initiation protein DivIVA
MVNLSIQTEQLLLIINFVVTAVLIGYSFYLYGIERNLRKKFRSINTRAANIIEDANNKAIHIINHSKYISDAMKEHAERSFEHVLSDLKQENKKFYSSLERAYFDSSERFINGIQKESQNEVGEFSKKIAETTNQTKTKLEERLESEYQEAKKDINKFKEMKKREFENSLKERIASISVSVLPKYFNVDDQEKFAKEVIEKASSEGFFN